MGSNTFTQITCCTISTETITCGFPSNVAFNGDFFLHPVRSHFCLPHQVFKGSNFSVSRAIKIFFWLNLQWISAHHHWPFSRALLFLPLLSLCSVRRPAGPADSVGFLMGSHGLNALIMSSAKQVRRGVWLHELSHHAAHNQAVVLLPLSKLYTAPHTVIYGGLSVLKPCQHWCSLSELYDKWRNVNFIACASRWVKVWCARTAGYTADCGK